MLLHSVTRCEKYKIIIPSFHDTANVLVPTPPLPVVVHNSYSTPSANLVWGINVSVSGVTSCSSEAKTYSRQWNCWQLQKELTDLNYMYGSKELSPQSQRTTMWRYCRSPKELWPEARSSKWVWSQLKTFVLQNFLLLTFCSPGFRKLIVARKSHRTFWS